jgi:hypothetical protein
MPSLLSTIKGPLPTPVGLSKTCAARLRCAREIAWHWSSIASPPLCVPIIALIGAQYGQHPLYLAPAVSSGCSTRGSAIACNCAAFDFSGGRRAHPSHLDPVRAYPARFRSLVRKCAQ